jgi:hypothetical protein
MQLSSNADTKLALAGAVLAGIGDHKTATVKYDSDKTNPSALVKATTNAGFPSSLHDGDKK